MNHSVLQSLFSSSSRSSTATGPVDDRLFDPVIGLVVENKGDPEGLGRVKVSFPTLGLSDQETSHWASVASQGASADQGWYFLPEEGDEVLVLFSHGDISRPVIIGSMWNGQDKPPEQVNTRATIATRSGARVSFDDEAGTLTLEDGSKAARVVLDANNNKITLESGDGDVTLQAPKGQANIVADKIEMDAPKTYVEALGAIKIGTQSGLDIRATGNVHAHAQSIDLNPAGAVEGPTAKTADCSEVPDPLPEK